MSGADGGRSRGRIGPDDGVAVVGLGKMGLPVARNLGAAGFRVVGVDASSQAREAAATLGLGTAATAGEAAALTAMTIVLVGFDHQVLQVVSGPDGILAGAAPGHVVAVSSSVQPDTVRAAATAAAAAGVHVLDTPVCRGEPAAEDGTLLVMCGGPAAVLERVSPVLDVVAADVYRLGDVGAGQVGKMLNNYLLWSAVVADQEALRLGRRLGADLDALREALVLSSGDNWALQTWTRARPMPWAEEDMRALSRYAREVDLETPLADVVREQITLVKQRKGASGGPASSMDDYVRAHP